MLSKMLKGNEMTVDLRSDTTTRLTKQMLQAMVNAPVGDDNFGDDPTLNHLEEVAAQKIGKEAALFLPTGRMGNQVAILSHTHRGDEIIADVDSHIFNSELGAYAVISSVTVRPVAVSNGLMKPEDLSAQIRPAGTQPKTGLICIENTHNKAGGVPVPLPNMAQLCQLAHSHGVPVHVDGARIFNASIALGVPVEALVGEADSVMFSLSKALCLPFGAILAGSREFINKARAHRKLCGGQMGQVGYIAAAGLYALEHMVEEIEEDHVKAKLLAQGLSNMTDINVNKVESNIVIFDITNTRFNSSELLNLLLKHRIMAYAFSDSLIRMIPTRYTSKQDIEYTVECVDKIINSV